VVRDGELVYSAGYGTANLEYGIPITPSTVFHVASVSKQFTAFAVTMLAEQGKLSLDDDVRRYIPEVPDFGKTITLRHLIHHISGLRDQWSLLGMAGWRLDDVITREDILRLVARQQDLNFDPGAESLYCNTGYTLLAEVVARVTGQSFPAWTAANIFEPLGMAHTHFHDDHRMVVPNRAYSYARGDEGGFENRVLSFANVGATSLFTTAEDLARWMANFEDGRLGGPALIERMHTRGVLNGGEELAYAHGIYFGDYRGQQTVGHAGSDAGFRSDVVRFPEHHLSVVVLSNLADLGPGQRTREVAEVFLDGVLPPPEAASPEPAPPTPAGVDVPFEDYAGLYTLEPGWVLAVFRDEDRLMVRATGEGAYPMTPVAEDRFVVEGYSGSEIRFDRNRRGRVEALVYREITAPRREPPAPETLMAYTGDYYSEELETTYHFVVEDGRLLARHQRHGDILLTPAGGDDFAGEAWFLRTIQCDREAGHVQGCRVSNGRVRNLRFERR
jgi:CubicO group peptidase (beta-lactamase class C family)